jgi:hypothetical protein
MAALIGAGTASARVRDTSAAVVGTQSAEIGVFALSTPNLAEHALSKMLRRIAAVDDVQSADLGPNVSVSLLPTIWSSASVLWGHDGDDKDKDHDWNKDHDWDKDHDRDKGHERKGGAPAPTPEPSTLLSFGAAIVIGGAVLLSRRLRASRK